MLWTPLQSPACLSDRLAFIIAGLRGVLAAHMAKDRSAVAVLFLAWARVGRLVSRFEALVAAVRAGRLPAGPAPRVQAGPDLELPRLEGLPPPRLPGGFGWLIRLCTGGDGLWQSGAELAGRPGDGAAARLCSPKLV